MADTASPLDRAKANATGSGGSNFNGWWVLVVVNAALAAWAGATPHLAHKLVFGHEPGDDVTITLWKFLAAGFVIITGVAYALAEAVKKGAEGKASYLLLDLGIIVHESMSLLLMPLAAPLFRREALMFGPPIFITAGSIAAYHYNRASPKGLTPQSVKEPLMETIKSRPSDQSKKVTASIYFAMAAALAMLAVAYLVAPARFLASAFGTPGPKEAMAQVQTLGGGFLLPAAIFTYALQTSVVKSDIPSSVFKVVNATMAAAALIHVMSMLPLLQQSGKTGPGAPILFAFWALSAPIFGSQAVMA